MLKLASFFMGILLSKPGRQPGKFQAPEFLLILIAWSVPFRSIRLLDKVYTPQVPKNITFYHLRHARRRYVEFFRDLFGLCRSLVLSNKIENSLKIFFKSINVH